MRIDKCRKLSKKEYHLQRGYPLPDMLETISEFSNDSPRDILLTHQGYWDEVVALEDLHCQLFTDGINETFLDHPLLVLGFVHEFHKDFTIYFLYNTHLTTSIPRALSSVR